MSKFLEVPKIAKTPMSALGEAYKYILEEFRRDSLNIMPDNEELEIDEENLMQFLIDKSRNANLRMYGSGKELLENIRIFEKFPRNYKFFDTDEEPYQTTPTIFYNLKNEKFISKSDIFVVLQNLMMKVKTEKYCIEQLAFVVFHLRRHEERVEDLMGFVRFDEKIFDRIYEELKSKICGKLPTIAEMNQLGNEMPRLSMSQIFRKFQSLSPDAYDRYPKRKEYVEYLLERYNEVESRGFFGEIAIPKLFWMIQNHLKSLQEVIDKHPEMFQGGPITVRLFEDGVEQKIGVDQKFVMKSELFRAIKKVSSNRIDYHNKDITAFVKTMDFQEALEKFGEQIRDVQFIRTPILRAKHRAVPIPEVFNDEYGVLAVDAFFDTMKSLIFGVKFFQTENGASWDDRRPLLEQLQCTFLAEEKNPYFISSKAVELLKQVCSLRIYRARNVRNAKKDGFTVQNLKNELAHLGLTTTFPEIQNHADVVYSEVVKKKKERFLRTCDLFDAIEHCQLICVLEMFPKMKQFLHNQKGCHRVYGYKCEDCDKIQMTSSPESSKIQMSPEEYEKTLELQNPSKIQNLEESTPSEVAHQNSEKNKKKKDKKKAKLAEKKKLEKDSEVAPESQKVPEDVKTSEKSENPKSENSKQKTSELAPEVRKLTSKSQQIPEDVKAAPDDKNMIHEAPESLEDPQKEISELKEQVAKLKEELADEKQKTSEILVAKNREIQKLNELNQRMIRQLLEKLEMSSGADYSNPSSSGF